MTAPAEPPPLTGPTRCSLCKGETKELPIPAGVTMPPIRPRVCPKCDRLR